VVNPRQGMRNPQSIPTTIHCRHLFRFIATASGTTVMTNWGLTTLLSVCYTANTSARGLFYAVRIKYVEIWSPVSAIGSTASAAIRYSGGLLGSDINFSDTTMNVSEPAHVRASPPPRSQASFWMNNDDAVTPLCTIGYTASSVVDVHVDLILVNTSQTIVTAITSGTDGYLYALPLDLNYAGTHNLIPVGLQTTY
jgi:hypothetical protein